MNSALPWAIGIVIIAQIGSGGGGPPSRNKVIEQAALREILECAVKNTKPEFELEDWQLDVWKVFNNNFGCNLQELLKGVSADPIALWDGPASGPERMEDGWRGCRGYHAFHLKFQKMKFTVVLRCEKHSKWDQHRQEEASKMICEAILDQQFEELEGLSVFDIYSLSESPIVWRTLKSELADQLISR